MHAKKKNPHKIIFSHGTLGFFSMILPEKAIVYNAQFLVTHGKIHREMLIILSKEERSNIGSQVFIFYLNDLSFDYIKIVNYLVAAQNLGDVKGILDFKPSMIFLKYQFRNMADTELKSILIGGLLVLPLSKKSFLSDDKNISF